MIIKDNRTEPLFTPSGCLTATALEQLAHGALSREALSLAKSHIASCELCADALEGVNAWRNNKSNSPSGPPLSATAFSSHTASIRERLNEKYLNQQSHEPGTITRRLPRRTAWIAIAASLLLFVGIYLLFLVNPRFKPSPLAMEKNVSMEKGRDQSAPGNDSQSKSTGMSRMDPKNSKAEEAKKEKLTAPDIFTQDELHITNEDHPGKIKSTIQFTPPVIKKDEDVRDIEEKKEKTEITNSRLALPTDETAVSGVSPVLEMADMNAKSNKAGTRELVEEETSMPFTVVEQMPEFPGGQEKMMKFLRENIQYPTLAAENGIQGSVYLSFIVEGTGKIRDIKVLRGVGGGLDEEAMRVVKLMPQWVPGKQNGKAVAVLFDLPVKFTLTDK